MQFRERKITLNNLKHTTIKRINILKDKLKMEHSNTRKTKFTKGVLGLKACSNMASNCVFL